MAKKIQKLVSSLKHLGLTKEDTTKLLSFVGLSVKPQKKVINVIDDEGEKDLFVTRVGWGPIHTKYGGFDQYEFSVDDTWGKYNIISKSAAHDQYGNPMFRENKPLLVRIDSGCETGQRFHDNTCECSEQLEKAMELISNVGEGIIINIPEQDGRGQGLTFKLATLGIQQYGLDTVQAAKFLHQYLEGMEISKEEEDVTKYIDRRTYAGAVAILKFFNVTIKTEINIATNNPLKVNAFKTNGYRTSNQPVVIPPTQQTKMHLEAKKKHLKHLL